jgi:hypothetical protein
MGRKIDTIELAETRDGRTAVASIMFDQEMAYLSRSRIIEVTIGDQLVLMPADLLQKALVDLDNKHKSAVQDAA